MIERSGPELSLASLSWSPFFADQLQPEETDLIPVRIASVHRDRLKAVTQAGQIDLTLAAKMSTADFAVGDWVLAEPHSNKLVRRLTRRTLLQRRVEGRNGQQLIAANVDTLFIVTSCNADFEPARLERYLSMANESGTKPVLLLTKADTAGDAQPYIRQASELQSGLDIIALDARSADAAAILAPWCGPGQTVAMVGSSGVGKSTLVNTLMGPGQDRQQRTGSIREHDAKGRHTTTARSLHPIQGGGWVIDTPGIRTLLVSDSAEGIDLLFAEIAALEPQCKFRNCRHGDEPGCAVQGAIKAGTLTVERLLRWRTLRDENQHNTPLLTGARGNKSIRKKY